MSQVLPIENRCTDPATFIAWNGVLNVGCAITFAVYSAVAYFGYAATGSGVRDSITLNLPNTEYA
jgi:amino acid permease